MKFFICALLIPMASGQLSGEASVALEVFYHDCEKYDNDGLGIEVCGDDGATYRNPIHLSCLNYKRSKTPSVKIMSFGSCPGSTDQSGCPWSPFFEPVCGSDGKTYVNKERVHCVSNETGNHITVEKMMECDEEDPCCKDEEITPGPKVCATNGITYASANVVLCLSKLRADIEIKHEGGCTVNDVAELYPSRVKVCSISRHHYEFNPICGANNVSYLNPFVFLCYSPLAEPVFCGGNCNSEAHDACQSAINLDKEYDECKKDVVVEEVCGYDGLTYRSKDHLMCAARNNSLLTVLHEGKCIHEDSPCLRARSANGFPVCGSDGVTYSTPLALFCIARSKDRGLKYVHSGPCVRRRNRPLNIFSLSIKNKFT